MSGQFEAALEAARQRDDRGPLIGEIEAYCQRAGCSARTVTIAIKEYDGLTPSKLWCPACSSPLKVHHVLTLGEADEQFAADARGEVNRQLYVERERRRLGDPNAFVAIPVSVLLDDRLPRVVDEAEG